MPDLKRLLLALRCIGVGFALLGLGAGPAQAEGFAGLEILPEPVMREDSPALLNAGGTAVPLSGAPVTVLNFWATWCAPCVAELPALSRAAAALADDGIVVMLVSIDRGGAAKAVPFLERLGVTGVRLGFDPKAKLSREVGIRGLPTTLLLPPSQDTAWRFVGPFEWDSDEMLTLIRDLAGT